MALDVNRHETAELLSASGSLERAVLSVFADGNLMPLFRIEEYRHRAWLLMLTHLRPTMAALHQRFGYLGVFPSWQTEDYDDTMEQAENGSTWAFELTAACQEQDCEGWLHSLGSRNGFVPLRAQAAEALLQPCPEGLRLLSWQGRLLVTDSTAFRDGLYSGLGDGRAHGIGLMTIG